MADDSIISAERRAVLMAFVDAPLHTLDAEAELLPGLDAAIRAGQVNEKPIDENGHSYWLSTKGRDALALPSEAFWRRIWRSSFPL